MRDSNKKTLFALVGFLLMIAVIIFIGVFFSKEKVEIQEDAIEEVTVEETQTIAPRKAIIGTSVEGRSIELYTFGSGGTNILLVGGIHGGYEWNSVLLAYQFIDYYTTNPATVPSNITLTIIPSANPDGLFEVIKKEGRFTASDIQQEDTSTGLGRFNANGVDLNRNFDCKWKPESTWRGKTMSAGTTAFSEPEAQAIKSVVSTTGPKAVLFFHSQASAVYASECENGILPVTREIMNTYSVASGYKAVDVFDSYEITGDAEGWLASIGIPAITVELSTHQTIEWEKNFAGVKAVLSYFGE